MIQRSGRSKMSTKHQEGFSGASHQSEAGNIQNSPNNSTNLSFAGCGFLGIYHLGVACTLTKYGQPFLKGVDRFAGASAGSLVAAVLAVRPDDPEIIKECMDFTFDLARMVHGHRLGLLTPGLCLLDHLERFLQSHLPEDAHVTARGRLYISLTSTSSSSSSPSSSSSCSCTGGQSRKQAPMGKGRNSVVSEYDSKQDLIQCLLASSYVPRITGTRPVERHGMKFIDGGMSNNLPILQEGRTICVSPFSGRYEICPRDSSAQNTRGLHVNINCQDFKVNYRNVVRGLHAFFPPKLSQLEQYYAKGVRDATEFLHQEGAFHDKDGEGGPPSHTEEGGQGPHDSTVQFETHL